MRVLHVITGLGLGGAEAQLTGMLVTAPLPGVEPHVASLLSGGANAGRLREAGVPVADLGLSRALPDPRAVLALRAAMLRLRPDVVQGWMYHADLLATLAHASLPRSRRPRLVWGVRCSDMDTSRYGLRLRAVIRALVALSDRPDAAVSNSEAGRRVHEALGYRVRPFPVIPNGIDTARYRPDPEARMAVRGELGIPPEARVAALVARVDPMKDHEGFLAALDRLPGVIGLLAGAGTEELPDRPDLRRLGRRADVERVLPAADIVVSASAFGEGFSNALAEGMAAGLPAVATDVGDARLILGETGIVVAPRDPGALAAAMNLLLEEPLMRRIERGEAARRRVVDNFRFETAHRAFLDLYRSLA